MSGAVPTPLPRDAAPMAALQYDAATIDSIRAACAQLLRRQLETGQYSGPQRQAWLARHRQSDPEFLTNPKAAGCPVTTTKDNHHAQT